MRFQFAAITSLAMGCSTQSVSHIPQAAKLQAISYNDRTISTSESRRASAIEPLQVIESKQTSVADAGTRSNDASVTPRCDRVPSCYMVTHRIDSAFARSVGFARDSAGNAVSRRHSWSGTARADAIRLVEMNAACDNGAGYFIHDGVHVWVPVFSSDSRDCGTHVCSDGGYEFEDVPTPVNASAFRTLGAGFYTDDRHVFMGTEVQDDTPHPDPQTFRLCADSPGPHYVAVDANGPFGYFECGGILRIR